MGTLYEMTEIARRLYELYENEEIDEQTVRDTLEGIGVEGKLEDYCRVIRQLEADAEMYKREKMRIADRQSRAEKHIQKMKDAVTSFMNAKGMREEKAGIFALKFRTSEQIIVDDLNKISEEYLKYSEPTVDKTAVKKALKSGIEINGVHIETKDNLQIK